MKREDDMTEAATDKLYAHHRQQLSAMLDGALPPDQAKFMLRRLRHDSELAACWERWQVCGDVLRGRHEALLPRDFSQRIAHAIAEAAAPAAPAGQAVVAGRQRAHPRWTRWGGGALAASVAMLALLVGRQMQSPVAPAAVPAPLAATMPAAAQPQPQPAKPDRAVPAAPDTAVQLASAVAVAALPRRSAQRGASRGQAQRAAARLRGAAGLPAVAVAAVNQMPAPTLPVVATVRDPFAAHSIAPARPWPHAILPGYAAGDSFNASYGGSTAGEAVFHPFEPRVEPSTPISGNPDGPGPR